jgi:ketose-bisphosphate aldolase
MTLTSSKEMLLNARIQGFAVGAFNAENMEMCQAIAMAAQETRSPVIIQTTPGTLKHANAFTFQGMVKAIASESMVPIALHLDHGESLEAAMTAISAGYTSIMIDGSKLPFEDNMAVTKKVVEACSPVKIPVEGELGTVGGKEDGFESKGGGYTDPQEAKRFAKETKVSSLAVGVGTAHGFYKETPVLKISLIAEIKSLVDVPLVLHGASGLSDDTVRECIRAGISKVNFATELRAAFTKAVRDKLAEDPKLFDPKALGKAGREAVKALAMEKMRVLGSVGKAA